ncbi:MAG: hypothetical protein E5V63_25860 [Mesorhizobium sp.]|nr:MAG: hypothetical protein E5V63_25860 [Mesorhizobium sp.]
MTEQYKGAESNVRGIGEGQNKGGAAMGAALAASAWATTESSDFPKIETFEACQASISPDGDACEFSVKHENRQKSLVCVPFSRIGALYHEVRYATQLMVYRQRLRLDKGMEKLLELCATALRPSTTEVIVEPDTGDRLVIYQFTEHAPFCLRISPVEMDAFIEKLKLASKKASH